MARRKRIIVLGYGAAGAAIVHQIARHYDVTVLSRNPNEGSTTTNQKWKHSGLLYHHSRLAKQMWEVYQSMDYTLEHPFVLKPRARFLAINQETLQERVDTWRRWGVWSWGMAVEPLAGFEYRSAGLLGRTNAAGGFATPDCVMDFPELIRNLRYSSEANGAQFIDDASVEELCIEGNRVTGLTYRKENVEHTIECDICIVALGAWTPAFIARHPGAHSLPIVLRKCIVMRYQEELVPCLTVCLDIREGIGSDAALVPFKGETIAAESIGTETQDPEDRSVDKERVSKLMVDYARCFPELIAHRPSTVDVCFKAEQRSRSGAPNLDYQIYTNEHHALEGVIAAIPGKASLMFQMAEVVQNSVRNLARQLDG